MKLSFKTLLIVVILLISRFAYSQFDSSYVHITKDKFSIYPMSELHTSTYHLKFNETQYDSDEVDAYYRSQENIYLGFGMSFYRFGFALSFKIPYSDIPELKKSRAFSFSGGYSYKKLYGELKLNSYHGLQQETVNYLDDTTITQITIRENIVTKHMSLMLYYITSDKYNFDANFKNYNYQKKSAISFVTGGGFNYYSFLGELDFVETEQNESLEIEKNVLVYSLKLMPGLAATLVLNKFYFSAFTLVGATYNYNVLDNISVRHKVSPSFEIRSVIGYNNKNLFVSLNFNYDYDLIFLRENKLGINNYMINLKLGIKLDSKYLGKIGPYL